MRSGEILLGVGACDRLAVPSRGERRVEILPVPYWHKLRPCQSYWRIQFFLCPFIHFINPCYLLILIVGVISGTTISIPSSGMVVMAEGTGAASSTVIQQATSQPLVEVHAGEAPGMQWQVQGTNDVSEFLRKMNAERMHLEQQLGREEETAVHKLLKEQVRIEDNTETECCVLRFCLFILEENFGMLSLSFVNTLQYFLSTFFSGLRPLS